MRSSADIEKRPKKSDGSKRHDTKQKRGKRKTTSKWNKIEHRLFCYITKSWQGKPLIDVQTAIDLIGATRTTTGLKVICVQDDTEYELAKKVSDEDFATINLEKIAPFESWNYRILPR